MKKGATGHSFIHKEVTSYKIHTLAYFFIVMLKKLQQNSAWQKLQDEEQID